MPLGLRPISSGPLSSFFGTPAVQTTTTTIMRFATQSFTTRPTDAPAHSYIPGYLKSNLQLGRRVTQSAEGQFGALIEATYGEIELDNSEGQLDELVRAYRADGRSVTMKIGATELTNLGRKRMQPYQFFETVYRTVAADFFHEENTVRIALSSMMSRLDNRLQQQVYTGSGGVSGTEDMTGRTMPATLGRCLNVSAQILDPTILTYDVHSGSISEVQAVYDAGVELSFYTNYPSYAALASATIPDGAYGTSLVAGKIKIGTPPFGQITANVRGDIDNGNGFYVGLHASIIRMVLRDYAGFTNSQLDLDSFDVLNSLQTWEMGLFLPAGDQSTTRDVIERIAVSCGAIVGQDRSGLFRVKRLDAPKASPDWIFTDRDILMDRFARLRLPYRVPWRTWDVGYSKNWTIQSEGEIAAGVSATRKTFLESEYRHAYALNATISQAHATSHTAPFRPALFVGSVGAQQEADRLIALYSYDRAMYRFAIKTALFSVELGQTIRIILDRYDLQNGRNFVVTEIYDDADTAETDLVVFG